MWDLIFGMSWIRVGLWNRIRLWTGIICGAGHHEMDIIN